MLIYYIYRTQQPVTKQALLHFLEYIYTGRVWKFVENASAVVRVPKVRDSHTFCLFTGYSYI